MLLVARYIDRRWPGGRTSAVARTRFIDAAAGSALSAGVEQVVLLGAGFDSRAYRIPAMARTTVFEVDHPSTSAEKQRTLRAALAAMPLHVRFVPVDFNVQRLPEAMSAAGYDPARRTLFLWEGVTNYLTEGAVHETLRWCASAAAGSTLVFTYVHQQVLDSPETFHGTQALFAALDAASERWTFGLDPRVLSDYLSQRGLALETDIGAAEYRALCFGAAAKRMRGYEFYRIAVARVPGASQDG